MSPLNNQREFTRVTVAIHSELRVGGNVVVHGMLENVSFNGILLHSDALLPPQTPCRVYIFLDGGQGGPIIEAQGQVIRTEPQKLGVMFTEVIGTDSTHHLQNLVLYNSGNLSVQVEQEFESNSGLLPKS